MHTTPPPYCITCSLLYLPAYRRMDTYSHPYLLPFKTVTISPSVPPVKPSLIFICYPSLPHSSCPSFQHPGQTSLYEANIHSSPKHLFHTPLLKQSSQLLVSLVTVSSSSSSAHSHIHSQPLTSPLLFTWFSSSACLACVETVTTHSQFPKGTERH